MKFKIGETYNANNNKHQCDTASASNASVKKQRSTSKVSPAFKRSRIVRPVDDAGGLAVSMELEVRLLVSLERTNIQNAISFLEVQDGVMEASGKIVNRMIELKGLSGILLKNSSDIENYNREFKDLQVQLKDMASVKFNGVSLFAQYTDSSYGSVQEGVFDNISRDTLSIFVSAEGTGAKSQYCKINATLSNHNSRLPVICSFNAGTGNVITFAADSSMRQLIYPMFRWRFCKHWKISPPSSNNGAHQCRLRFASDNIATTKTNMEAANDPGVDVDIASESPIWPIQCLGSGVGIDARSGQYSVNIALMLIR